MTRDANFKRRVRARMTTTDEAYVTARRHLDRRDGSSTQPSVLHVTNGDSTAGTLREAGVRGRVLPWRDVLHDGPVPGGLAPAVLRRVRAEHLAGRGWGEAGAIEADMEARDRLLEGHVGGDYVLWFEADLYDQLQLVQVLDDLARLRVAPERVTLVSVGEHRGIAHFGGLGELTAGQLLDLAAAEGVPLSASALELAVAAWAAFTGPDPVALVAISRARSTTLRFLGEAVVRLLQEYPSRSDGLSLTQRRILLGAAEGRATPARIFARVREAERRPFLGDGPCFAYVRELAECEVPLLQIGDPDRPFVERPVQLTATGQQVLAAKADHGRLNGFDRWIGGVRLTGRSTCWRYDERLEALVPETG